MFRLSIIHLRPTYQVYKLPAIAISCICICTVSNLLMVSLVTTNLTLISHVLNFNWPHFSLIHVIWISHCTPYNREYMASLLVSKLLCLFIYTVNNHAWINNVCRDELHKTPDLLTHHALWIYIESLNMKR